MVLCRWPRWRRSCSSRMTGQMSPASFSLEVLTSKLNYHNQICLIRGCRWVLQCSMFFISFRVIELSPLTAFPFPTDEGAQVGWCVLWRRERLQSGNRIECRSSIEREIHSGEKAHWTLLRWDLTGEPIWVNNNCVSFIIEVTRILHNRQETCRNIVRNKKYSIDFKQNCVPGYRQVLFRRRRYIKGPGNGSSWNSHLLGKPRHNEVRIPLHNRIISELCRHLLWFYFNIKFKWS